MAVTYEDLLFWHAFVSRIGFIPLCNLRSVANAFHVLQEHLLAAAVIEFGGPAVGVAGDALSGFKSAVIFQKIRDAGRPE